MRWASGQNDFSIDPNDDTRVNIEVTSLYLQDEMALSESFDLVVGARFDQFEIDVVNMLANDVREKRDEEISQAGYGL